ncbi:MAG: ATP phosphoribosyltransferase [Dehalococcoidia bacterium]|nr:ATP phosphoribosyltransferase [Dehalococcoidia bacterium]
MTPRLKIALPKGRLLGQTRSLLERGGLGFDAYTDGGRHYRLESSMLPGVGAKIFQERDVPIQVAIGNYDLGICGCQWIEELLSGYPLGSLVRVAELGYGSGSVFAAVSRFSEYRSARDLSRRITPLRIVSEYPNLAEAVAVRLRMRRFKVFPLWGSAEAYPPENSEVAILWRESASMIYNEGLLPLSEVLTGGACLVANKESWGRRELGEVVSRICQSVRPVEETPGASIAQTSEVRAAPVDNGKDYVWLALPDGHQQNHASKFLEKAGISVDGYSAKSGNRYPGTNLVGVKVKVIRPQDMPMQVANGNFDLAVTGIDWLTDHKNRFPQSPVEQVLDLGFGRVRIVAAMDGAESVEDITQLRRWLQSKGRFLRVASEYVNIADRFARENHLIPYRVIPTWGATEAFIPEDADLLIENTETGRTLAENNLRIIDTLGISTACVIANTNARVSPEKRAGVQAVIDAFKRGMV